VRGGLWGEWGKKMPPKLKKKRENSRVPIKTTPKKKVQEIDSSWGLPLSRRRGGEKGKPGKKKTGPQRCLIKVGGAGQRKASRMDREGDVIRPDGGKKKKRGSGIKVPAGKKAP